MEAKRKFKAESVKFHGDQIVAVEVNGEVEVLVSFLVESLGLNYNSAVSGLKNDEILGPDTVVRSVQVGDNQARSYLTLPVRRVEGWLFSIQLSKVSPEVKEKLLIYKKECYDVLHEHFRGKHKMLRKNSQERIQIKEQMKSLNDDLAKLKKRLKQLEKNDREIHLSLCPTLFDHLFDNEPEAVSDR